MDQVPCLLCASYMWWGDPELRPLLGLAWDCGAVTTGPVTVPVLLALGIGVMKTQKERRARERGGVGAEARAGGGREMVSEAAANALEGFGIVTLASLMPATRCASQSAIVALATHAPRCHQKRLYGMTQCSSPSPMKCA